MGLGLGAACVLTELTEAGWRRPTIHFFFHCSSPEGLRHFWLHTKLFNDMNSSHLSYIETLHCFSVVCVPVLTNDLLKASGSGNLVESIKTGATNLMPSRAHICVAFMYVCCLICDTWQCLDWSTGSSSPSSSYDLSLCCKPVSQVSQLWPFCRRTKHLLSKKNKAPLPEKKVNIFSIFPAYEAPLINLCLVIKVSQIYLILDFQYLCSSIVVAHHVWMPSLDFFVQHTSAGQSDVLHARGQRSEVAVWLICWSLNQTSPPG